MVKVLDNFFSITARGSAISRELIGGLVTYLAMVYIVALQPIVMEAAGMEAARVFTSTALTAAIATLVMAFVGRLPLALASGLGLNTFVAYSLVGQFGFSWQMAILAVFIEGVIFVIISVTGLRSQIVNALPDVMKKAVGFGLALFIAIIGLTTTGIINPDAPTTLGINHITSGPPMVAMITLVIMIVLYCLGVPGGIMIAVIAGTIVAIPLGLVGRIGAVAFAAPYTPVDIINGIAGGSFNLVEFCTAFISMLFIDMFDTIGTFAGCTEAGNLKEKDGSIINIKQALLSDAIGTVAGSLFGATTVTTYIESSAGIASGARTGLASVVTGAMFLLTILLYPLIQVIPGCAVGVCLIFVGYLMLGSIANLDLKDPRVGLPSFITMLMMASSYSISKGIAYGLVSWILVKVCKKEARDIPAATWILGLIFVVYILFSPL
jgi:AGZA family xanthine/uracil permease-like MFS transporter